MTRNLWRQRYSPSSHDYARRSDGHGGRYWRQGATTDVERLWFRTRLEPAPEPGTPPCPKVSVRDAPLVAVSTYDAPLAPHQIAVLRWIADGCPAGVMAG